MARIGIYIPDELKARMDQVEHVNWSATAQRAFEVEVNLKEVLMSTEDSVVARLRASKVKEDEAEQVAGRKIGQKWARDWAEYGELKRVATYQHWDETPEEVYPSQLLCLIFAVDDRREIDTSDERELWQLLLDREVEPEPAWVEGFVEGVGEVWDEVGDKI